MQIKVTDIYSMNGSWYANVQALIDGEWLDLPIKTEAPQVVIERPEPAPVKEPRDDFGYYKISDIVRTAATKGDAILPISRSSWLRGIDEGKYPKPEKMGNLLIWKKEDIHALMDDIARGKFADD